MPQLDCLIVRQPYASLIAFGKKRWEFRKYDISKRGMIGIAASPNEPWATLQSELNYAASIFPRGVVLATCELSASFLVTYRELEMMRGQTVSVELHGRKLVTLDEPIGEPIEDVDKAIANREWESFAWLLKNVKPIDDPVPIQAKLRSTWTKVSFNHNR